MDDKEIRVHTDKRGKDHVDIYSNDPKEDHSSMHINWDSDTGKGTIVDTTDGEKGTTNIGCYLTSACMRHMQENFDDKCDELTILRWFRDNFVSKDDIEHYYKTAPIVVDAIENMPDNDTIYNYIYENVVVACMNAIKQGNYEFAYNRYENSILALEEEFARPELEQRLARILKLKATIN